MILNKKLFSKISCRKENLYTVLMAFILALILCGTVVNFIVDKLCIFEQQIEIQVIDEEDETEKNAVWIVKSGNDVDVFDDIVAQLDNNTSWEYRPKSEYTNQVFDSIIQTEKNPQSITFNTTVSGDKTLTFFALGQGNVVNIKSDNLNKEILLSTDVIGGQLISVKLFENYIFDKIILILSVIILTVLLYIILTALNWLYIVEIIKKYISKSCKIIDFIFLTFLIMIFFSITPIFTFDSIWYHVYFDIFSGNDPITSWDPSRGFAFPWILYMVTKIFGYTTQAMQIFMCISYLLMIALCFALAKMLMPKLLRYQVFAWILFTAFIFLNPIVVGYYHLVLTEVVLNTLILITLYVCLKTYNSASDERISYKKYFFIRLIVLSIIAFWSYFIKQPYLLVIVLPMVFSDFHYSILQKDTKKRLKIVCGSIVCLAVMIFSIVGFNSKWNQMIDIDNATTILGTQSTTSSVLTDSFITGLRYFSIEENGDKIIIKSLKNEKVEKECEIEKKDQSFLNSVNIVWNAIKLDPIKAFGGYIDNYLAIGNIYYFPNQVDRSVISKDISFTRAAENRILAYYPDTFEQGMMVYEKGMFFCDEYTTGIEQYEQRTDTNIFIKYIYNHFAQKIANFIFSITILFLPIGFVVSLIMLIRIKKRDIMLAFISMVSGSAFIYILFLAFMGQVIDRYASIWYIPILLMIFVLSCKLINYSYKYFKKNKNDISK